MLDTPLQNTVQCIAAKCFAESHHSRRLVESGMALKVLQKILKILQKILKVLQKVLNVLQKILKVLQKLLNY